MAFINIDFGVIQVNLIVTFVVLHLNNDDLLDLNIRVA